MRKLLAVLVFIAIPTSVIAQSAETMKKLLDAEAAKLQAWGSDAAIVAAVKAQNAKRVPLAQIQKTDEQWTAGKAAELIKQLTTGACADRLRELGAGNPAYGETFVMDDQGALVCSTVKTSDYWQGDEAKWQRAFNGGKGAVFIDRPKFDESASARLAQISVPVLDNGTVIGVVTIGVAADKLSR
jgi:hypothetical protein